MQSTTALLIAYVAAAGLLTVTPGLDTALVLRTAVARGARSRLLARPTVVQACERLTGAMFVAFGVGLALDSRRP